MPWAIISAQVIATAQLIKKTEPKLQLESMVNERHPIPTKMYLEALKANANFMEKVEVKEPRDLLREKITKAVKKEYSDKFYNSNKKVIDKIINDRLNPKPVFKYNHETKTLVPKVKEKSLFYRIYDWFISKFRSLRTQKQNKFYGTSGKTPIPLRRIINRNKQQRELMKEILS